MKDLYFKHLEYIGKLYLEQVLMHYDYDPIIFVCSDETNNAYLCICISMNGQQWIVTQADKSTIIDLLECRIDSRTAFLNGNPTKYIIESDSDFIESIVRANSDSFDKRLLPESGFFLESKFWSDGVEEYLALAKNELDDRIAAELFVENSLNGVPRSSSICEFSKSIVMKSHVLKNHDKYIKQFAQSKGDGYTFLEKTSIDSIPFQETFKKDNHDVYTDVVETELPFAS